VNNMPRQEESNVGSGNPYYGSGFTNFDRYLQQSNVDWGAQQAEPVQDSNDWSMKTGFDNWMIGAGKPQRDAAQPKAPTPMADTQPPSLDLSEPTPAPAPAPVTQDSRVPNDSEFPQFDKKYGKTREVW
jgi:hypothetical protein